MTRHALPEIKAVNMSATSVDTLKAWFERAKKQGATHLVVVCDTFDHDDYPVMVMPGDNVDAVIKQYSGQNMQTIHEVYKVSLGWEAQRGGRVWNV